MDHPDLARMRCRYAPLGRVMTDSRDVILRPRSADRRTEMTATSQKSYFTQSRLKR